MKPERADDLTLTSPTTHPPLRLKLRWASANSCDNAQQLPWSMAMSSWTGCRVAQWATVCACAGLGGQRMGDGAAMAISWSRTDEVSICIAFSRDAVAGPLSPMSRPPRLSPSLLSTLLLLFSAVLLLSLIPPSHAADTTQYCKCTCSQNVTIFVVDKCADCTRNKCVDLGTCTLPSTPGEPGSTPVPMPGDSSLSVSCFQRGSVKDELFVWIFIVVTASLLLYALVEPVFSWIWKPRYVTLGAS
ncbi:hypothetical protein M427DRAFT_309153 [Gonapodya prolifera JEL478]|uniref:Transmembrane protein n=1 Tax=Gonapodya prolifera (strain JEL478) TaxID=1344416 RepID=A0A139AG60_GONPJ|nr:hypothetical protein M427DRAFT_309153 [Gonapodya prolifera JEL478]|eukprot:KXS15812.1 hypothetical protein M427DRAFT_309153 [Gonapodya prolifera JEL478]